MSGSDSSVWHYSGVTPGEGCYVHLIQVSDMPLFVDAPNEDYHLRLPGPSYTPIDQGHNPDTSPYDSVPGLDLDGLHRPVDISGVVNAGSSAYTDMGACERQP